jgi:hypothetical protein
MSDPSSTGPTGDGPEGASGELIRRCGLCRRPIGDELFTLRALTLCPDCAETIRQRQGRPGSARTTALYGLVATSVCAALWALLSRATGHALPWLALPTGVVIGMAVHQGSGARGGLRLQLVAALLVYAAFVAPFVPPIFGGIADAIRKEQVAAQARPVAPSTTLRPAPEGPAAQPRGPHQPASIPQSKSIVATVEAYFVFTLIAWGLVLAAPFTAGSVSLLAPLSLSLGMLVAIRLNRRASLRGPYSTRS